MRYVASIGHETAKHFCTYVRELIWESVRTSEFPELPSRQKCIWLTKGRTIFITGLSGLDVPQSR
ncbi:DUF2441 domain-containing protein [Escherichia coli]